jgi:hypothetical protein
VSGVELQADAKAETSSAIAMARKSLELGITRPSSQVG